MPSYDLRKEKEIEQRLQIAYDVWWHDEGSRMKPKEGENLEQFVHRITEIAWSNGAFSQGMNG